MSKTEVFTKAIREAIGNGWDFKGMDTNDWQVRRGFIEGYVRVDNSDMLITASYYMRPKSVRVDKILIFDHDFAKALWGEHKLCGLCKVQHIQPKECQFGGGNNLLAWHYHLQQIVITDDSNLVEYIRSNI